jgi:hypothetical protein
VSDLSEQIEADRSRRSARTPRMTRKARRAARRGTAARPGGLTAYCGCRWTRTGDAWRHVTPCRAHPLRGPADDHEMTTLLTDTREDIH